MPRAAGADQLATRIVKEQWRSLKEEGNDSSCLDGIANEASNVTITVVFPFDDKTHRDKENFKRGFEDSSNVFLNRDIKFDPQKEQEEKDLFSDCYQKAGRYIAEKADILIALWDGVYTKKVGGTGDTLGYALSPECQKERRKHKLDPLEVYWLAIPRTSNRYPANEAFTWEKLYVARSSHHSRFRTVLGDRANLWFVLTVTVGIASVLCSWLGSCLRGQNLAPRWICCLSLSVIWS